jgi:hypothetical protein
MNKKFSNQKEKDYSFQFTFTFVPDFVIKPITASVELMRKSLQINFR